MKIRNTILTLAELSAVGTWAIVFGISMYWLPNASPEIKADAPWIVFFFLVYLGCFLAVARDNLPPHSIPGSIAVMALQLFTAFAIMWMMPMDFLPILTIIWVAMLPHVTSLGRSIVIMILVVALWFTVYSVHWEQKHVFFSGLLYGTFHLFAILMNHQTKLAEDATEESQRLNKELQATQNLLAEASRQNERTRIARDLHDLLGHHLTALIINLQVAGRLSEGEAKSKVDQCHSLAKLLLSDVREAVSTLRENQSLDFHKMIELMIAHLPNLEVHARIDAHLNLEDLDLAKSLLSIIQESLTNCMRHSGADQVWLSVSQKNETLYLEIYDNGQVRNDFVYGNGLKGMQERITELNGKLEFGRVEKALKLAIEIPQKEFALGH